MKIFCAWCLKEGKPALMAECPPLDDPSETHGIYPEHRQEVEDELEILRKTNAERQQALRKASIEAEKASQEHIETLRKKVDP